MSISCDSTYDQIKPTLQRLVKTALMLNVFSILGRYFSMFCKVNNFLEKEQNQT